jgi:hypothetical protein
MAAARRGDQAAFRYGVRVRAITYSTIRGSDEHGGPATVDKLGGDRRPDRTRPAAAEAIAHPFVHLLLPYSLDAIAPTG